jgi:hypothetical protein
MRAGGKNLARLPRTTNKHINKMIRIADKANWRIKQNRGNHIKCYSPDGKSIVIISGSGSQRSIKDVRADFKRGGLEIK